MTSAEDMAGNGPQYCLDELRREDRDRYQMLLFAPRVQRPVLAALYTFNLESARAVTAGWQQPTLGQMRLQWWRDALDNDTPITTEQARHPVLTVLADRSELWPEMRQLLAARERDLTDSPFAAVTDVVAHAEATGGRVAGIAAMVTGEMDGDLAAVRAAGTAYALAGMLRSIPYQQPGHAYVGRLCLPAELLHEHGLRAEDAWTGRQQEKVAACVSRLAAVAADEIDKLPSGRVDGSSISPLLHGTLARAYLKRLANAHYNPDSPNLGLHPLGRPLLLSWRALLRRP